MAEISYLHSSGKRISCGKPTTEIPQHVYEIWKFFDANPDCCELDDEEVQEKPQMFYRKAALFQARQYGRPEQGMENVVYPTEQQCIERTVATLQKQTKYRISQLKKVDIQNLQNNVSGLVFRKRITNRAIDLLTQELAKMPTVQT
jgi:hypothetical protein